jgi:trimeric autotransporter adhesin
MKKLSAIIKYLLGIVLIFYSAMPSQAQSGLYIAPNSSGISTPITGQTWLFNSSKNTISVYNGSTYQAVNTPFSNFSATTNPTTSNDNTQGYVLGSFWLNQTTSALYICQSPATSAAVWLGVNAVVTSIPLANLEQGGASNGQSLIWDGTSLVWTPGSPAIDLDQLNQDGATSGQVVTWNGSAWVASNAGAGTVTSVSTGNLSPLFTASIANSTTTPALSFSLSNAGAHTILSNATSGSAGPAYNSLSITAGTGLTGGGNLTTSPTISLTSPVVAAHGGTGQTSLTAYNVLLGNGTGTVGFAAPGTSGYPLLSAGSSSNPAFNQLSLSGSGISGVLPIAHGGTNATTGDAAINNLITGTATSGQVIQWNGTDWVPATVSGTGTVTTFGSGNLSPLFTTSVSNATTTPAQTFSLSNAGAYTILSNATNSSGAPSYNALTITAGTGLTGGGDLASSPTINLTTPVSNSNLGATVVTSVDNLSPLFTASISAQTLGFVLSSVGAHQYLGNSTGSSAAPAFQTIAAADLPSTTVNSVGNLSPLFTSSVTAQVLNFSLTNATGSGIFSNTSSSPATPAYNVLSLTAGAGLSGGGNLTSSPTISLSTPVSAAHGGTGTALFTSGVSTFVSAGTVAVSDASITSSSIIVVTQAGNGSALSEEFDVEVTAGTGFTIYSTNSSSTAIVNWIRIK